MDTKTLAPTLPPRDVIDERLNIQRMRLFQAANVLRNAIFRIDNEREDMSGLERSQFDCDITGSAELAVEILDAATNALEAAVILAAPRTEAGEKPAPQSSKTPYDILRSENPPNLQSLEKLAESLKVPLWVLMVPGIPDELCNDVGLKAIEKLVVDYLRCDARIRARRERSVKHE